MHTPTVLGTQRYIIDYYLCSIKSPWGADLSGQPGLHIPYVLPGLCPAKYSYKKGRSSGPALKKVITAFTPPVRSTFWIAFYVPLRPVSLCAYGYGLA